MWFRTDVVSKEATVVNLYIARDGKQYGPYSEEQVQSMLAAGQVMPQDLAWREGLESWVPLSQLLPAAASPMAPATPAPGQNPYASPSLYNPQQPYQAPQTVYQPGMPYSAQSREYASFLLRFGAVIIDTLILGVVGYGLQFAVMGSLGSPATPTPEDLSKLLLVQLAAIVINWLYFALMESSASQATLGKMACGIVVTDLNGGRIGFGRATGRYFAKILSGCLLLIGYLMMLWSPQKQCLHDQLAGTLVVKK
jgi:uncharacterized RDD family membrane protein YckC